MKKKTESILKWLETLPGVLFFLGMFGAIIIQVVSRYIFHRPLIWPFELSIFCYIYLIYLGAGIAARRGTHVVFDILFERFPPTMQTMITLCGNLFVLIVLLILFPSIIAYISFIGQIKSSALGIPWSWVLLSFPIGTGLIILHLTAQTFQTVTTLIKSRKR